MLAGRGLGLVVDHGGPEEKNTGGYVATQALVDATPDLMRALKITRGFGLVRHGCSFHVRRGRRSTEARPEQSGTPRLQLADNR